jgi:hypothetical protein
MMEVLRFTEDELLASAPGPLTCNCPEERTWKVKVFLNWLGSVSEVNWSDSSVGLDFYDTFQRVPRRTNRLIHALRETEVGTVVPTFVTERKPMGLAGEAKLANSTGVTGDALAFDLAGGHHLEICRAVSPVLSVSWGMRTYPRSLPRPIPNAAFFAEPSARIERMCASTACSVVPPGLWL